MRRNAGKRSCLNSSFHFPRASTLTFCKKMKLTLATAIWLVTLCTITRGDDIRVPAPIDQEEINTPNMPKIADWATLELLFSLKADTVIIDAKSPEELLDQLEKIVRNVEGGENIRFRKHEKLSPVHIELRLKSVPLAVLIKYMCEAGRMNCVFLKNEVYFIPLIG